MATQWYYEQQGNSYGPFSAAQLMDLAATGRIQPQDGVWKDGMTRRVLAAKVNTYSRPPRPRCPPPRPATPRPFQPPRRNRQPWPPPRQR